MTAMARIWFFVAWLMLVVLFIPVSLKTSAQSGRVTSSPQSKPDPVLTPPVKPLEESEVKPNRPVDIDADVYRLVFPTHYEGYLLNGQHINVGPSTKKNFIQALDEAGALGFKVVSTVGGFPVAFGKRDDVQHEYALFQTKGNFWNKGGFEASYTHLSRQGFQLIAGLDVGERCEDFTPMGEMPYRECVYEDLFLAERQKGVDEPGREHRLAFTGPSFRNKTATALNKQIGDRLNEGYYPTFLLSKFEILLELTGKRNESVDKADVRVVASGSRDDLAKEVNEMAKQGYRLSMVNNKIALMRRNGADATPTSYVWLDATAEDFENQLTQMQEQGAIYLMTYPSDRKVKNKLIFEQKASGDNTRREY
ncbi:MAG: hypothetical protein QOH96_3826, partial [Blastocatellia bacterium]|nr:hypothetical protein [Blastocatellia bacterium]